MSKSVRLTNDTYLDSSSIVHNKQKLNEIIDIETITNDNGTAIKFPNGIMICYNSKIEVEANAKKKEIQFPDNFKDYNISINLTNIYSVIRNVIWSFGDISNSGFYAFPCINNEASTTNITKFSYIAIGRWK